jgi:predicted NBD/HSP70 family sugar kinase
MKLLGSNHKTGAAWNRGLAVRLLRRHGTLSRNDISRMTQLQGSTLSYIVRELIEKNVVRAVGKRQSAQVGQKQVLLTLNPEMGWMLGVSVRPGAATLVLLDSAGGRIDGMQVPLQGSIETFPKQIHEALNRWLQRRGTPAGKMLGLGVGVPGVVDADAGVVLRSFPLHAVNVPFQQLLTDEFGVTAVVDHDACYGACAEATDGAAADVSHFIYFAVNVQPLASGFRLASYGSALYLQGKIYRGAFYGASELSGSLEPAPMDLTASEMAELTEADGAMPPPLIELADRIGASLSPIINLVDVQMAVLAGTARIVNRRFIAAVQAAVTKGLIAIPGRAVRVVRSSWEPESAARGAAIAAFDAVVDTGELFSDTDERKVIRSARNLNAQV